MSSDYFMRLLQCLLIFALLLQISACAESTVPPSQVAHPDELIVNKDGSVSFRPDITGEDIIVQVHGRPSRIYDCSGCQPSYKVFVYSIDSFMAGIGDYDLCEFIGLVYDPQYAIFAFKTMETIKMHGYHDDQLFEKELKAWCSKNLRLSCAGCEIIQIRGATKHTF
jgi:hypothetical protein